jgi:hypothetical protein
MVFLTSLNILDTGFATKLKDTTQLAASYRVNSGAALQLKGVTFEIGSSANLDPAAFPTNTTQTTVPFISTNPRAFSITILLNSLNDSTSNAFGINDVSILAQIIRLPETYGLKAIYYPVTATATGDIRKRDNQLITQMGAVDTTEAQGDINLTLWNGSTSATGNDLTDVKYVPCRFSSCSITQEPNNMIKVRLEGVWSI